MIVQVSDKLLVVTYQRTMRKIKSMKLENENGAISHHIKI